MRIVLSVFVLVFSGAVVNAAPDSLAALVDKMKTQHIPFVHELWINAGTKADKSAVMLDITLEKIVEKFVENQKFESSQKWPQACESLDEMLLSAKIATKFSGELTQANKANSFGTISKDSNDLVTLTAARRAATCKRAGIDPEALRRSKFQFNTPTAPPAPTVQDRKDLADLSAAVNAGKSAMLAGQAAGKAKNYALACKEFTLASEKLNFVEDYGAVVAASFADRGMYNAPIQAISKEAGSFAPIAAQRKSMSCGRGAAK